MTFLKPLSILFLASLLALALQCNSVVWADVIVTPQGLADQVKAYVLKTTPLDDPQATLQVDVVKLPVKPITLKGTEVKILLDDHRTTPLCFRTIIQVTLSTEVETKYLGIPVHLSVEKPVWVATHFIRAQDRITAKDVMVQRKRLEYEAPYAIDSKETIASYTARTNMAPGSVLDSRNLILTPAIYRNDNVLLILSVGNGIQVSAYGIALEDGAIGKRIRVSQKLADSKTKFYTGEVVDKNTVMIQL